MKIIILTALISTVTFLSCNKNVEKPTDKTVFPIENLHKDVTFHEFLLDIRKQVSEIQDIHTLQNYISDGQLSEYEKSNIHKVFGYTDKDLFWKDRTLQNNRLVDLSKNYDLRNITEKQKRNAIEKAFLTLKLFSKTSTTGQIQQRLIDDPCETIRVNCIASVAAESAIMHLGCAALDLSIIAGIICHAAAFTYQYTAGNNCNLEAAKCKEAGAN
jgi:hypothetical protein